MTTWSTTWTWRSSVRSYPPREQHDMKRMAKISLTAAILGALVVLIVVSGCGGGDDDAVIVTLTPASIDAESGGSFTVDVEVDPKGQGISAAEVIYKLRHPGVCLRGVWRQGELLGASPLVGVESADQEIGQLIFALARRGATSAPTECRDSRNADIQGFGRRSSWRARADGVPGRACGRGPAGRAVDCVQFCDCEFVGPSCSAEAYRLGYQTVSI